MSALAPGYELTGDPARIDPAAAHAYLTRSYWSPGIPLETVRRAIANSICVAALKHGEQVAMARVVSDRATFAYLADVYVLAVHRGRGLGVALVRAMVDGEGAPPVHWILHTADAEGVYEKLGFRAGPLRYPLMERPRGPEHQ